MRLIPSQWRLLACALVVCLLVQTLALADGTIARCGQGWLEEINGYPVLHLKGTPYEMGYQHGALLKESALRNFTNILNMDEGKKVELGPIEVKPTDAIKTIVGMQRRFVPPEYFEELAGMSAGTGMKLEDVQVGNFIPELFHCSGFAIMNTATANGKLYHGRVLDYAIDWGLQDHAVIIIYEPDGGIPFVNVSYAGFIGCVTGMNAKSVSIGEMGGGGAGHWQGMPMALLVRHALRKAETLDQAIEIFEKTPRTCQYYYVVADGKTNQAVGMEASWDVFTVIKPGEKHPLLPTPVKDCALMSAGERYTELVRRVEAGYGKFTPESAMRLMDRGVAMKSNLHNVLFEPETTRFWVANATHDKKPAADQPYHAFQLTELLKRKPDRQSRELPLVTRATAAK
ncbi:MAG: C45 family peptidase [Planctomycetaceae bacterium]